MVAGITTITVPQSRLQKKLANEGVIVIDSLRERLIFSILVECCSVEKFIVQDLRLD